MIDPQFLNSQSLRSLPQDPDPALNQKLGLYQVFLKLYDQNRALLDEILNLESGAMALRASMFPYVQGTVLGSNAYLVTNLVGSRSQAMSQPQNIWTIGRDRQRVNLPVLDRRLSRCHASIEYIPQEGFYLRDLGSSNGSFINGEIVRHHAPLNDGDQVRLGSLAFTFFEVNELTQLNALSGQQVHQMSLADSPPTVPMDPPSHRWQEDEVEKCALPEDSIEDTSMFMRRRF